jgi:alpha-tubulin suppressor-like RCC1 family protein
MIKSSWAIAATAVIAVGGIFGSAGAASAASGGTPQTSAWTVWGDNVWGAAGVGSTASQITTPQSFTLPGGRTPASIVTGADNGAAIATDGTVWTWGLNGTGALGTGSVRKPKTTSPVRVALPSGVTIKQIAIGDTSMFALDAAGHVWAWGDNGAGELGDGTLGTMSNPTPRQVKLPAGLTVTDIAAAVHGGFALTSTGVIYSWGSNEVGELGNGSDSGDADATPTPVTAPHGVEFTSISTGGNAATATSTDGTHYVWGDNLNGQLLLSNPSLQYTSTPQPIDNTTGKAFVRLEVGTVFSLGLTADGSIYAWGNNTDGELGNGTTNPSAPQLSPVEVDAPANVTFTGVTAGAFAAYATATDGTVYAWGAGGGSLLGDGGTDDVLKPTLVPLSQAYHVGALSYGTSTIAAQVNGTPPAFGTSGLARATVGQQYSSTVAPAGPTTATFAVTAGALPAGLRLDTSTGSISGTPRRAGTHSFTITARNLVGSTAQRFAIAVHPADPRTGR